MTIPVKKVAILGAGIAGLACAWFLKKQFKDRVDITLFEKQNRVGGWLRSCREQGFFFEYGPRSIRGNDCEALLQLVREVGLENQLIEADKCASSRFLYLNGSLQQVPNSLWQVIGSPLTRPLLLDLIKEPWKPTAKTADESIASFFSRRFSSAVVERFIDPLIRGIYAGNPEQLSMRACFPSLWELEQKEGSLLWGGIKQRFAQRKNKEKPRSLLSFKDGLETLPAKIADQLDANIQLATLIDRIEYNREGTSLHFGHESHSFDHVISTISASAFAALVPDTKLSILLGKIPHTSVAIVPLAWHRAVNPFKGFGYLVPASQQEEILGAVFDSSAFPLQNGKLNETRLTVMIGNEGCATKTQDELIEIAKRSVKKHLGIISPPDFASAFVAQDAIPQYPVGHAELLKQIEKEAALYPSLTLSGISYRGVSVNHAILQSQRLAENFSL